MGIGAQRKNERARTDLEATGLKWPGQKMHPRAIMKSEEGTNTKSPSFSEVFKALFCIGEPFMGKNTPKNEISPLF